MPRSTTRALLFHVLIAAGTGCAAEAPTAPGEADEVGAVEAPLAFHSSAMPEDAERILARSHIRRADLDRVYRVDHYVRVGPGRRVHLVEHFSIRSWVQWPRRAALLLPGTVTNAEFYDIDVDGYRFAEELAREGSFVFAMDYEGSGESSYPDDGFGVTHDYLVESARRTLPFIRWARWVPRIDLIGESNGGAIAAELCRDGRRVRSCVLSSMLYEEGTPFLDAVFLDPGFLAFLASQPDGYIDVTADLYFNITSRTSPEVTAVILETQPGLYAVEPLRAPVALPWFDPSAAEVPALIVQGTEDNIALQSDSDRLAADYGSVGGGEATVLRIEGAGHIPRIEPGANEVWTEAVLSFLAL